MKKWLVYSLILGHHRISKQIFWPDCPAQEEFSVPVVAAALTDGTHRVLVDTGHHDTAWVTQHMAKATCAPEEELLTALRLGPCWGREDVDIVINTHLHFDHCGQNRLFPRAVLMTHRREWEAAHAPVPGQAALYLPELFDERATAPERWRFVEGDTELLDGLRLIETPGHSAGHLSVLADTAEGVLCIAGDACCTLRNLEENIAGSTVYSAGQTLDSYQRIRALADRVLPGHEPGLVSFQTSDFPRVKKEKNI